MPERNSICRAITASLRLVIFSSTSPLPLVPSLSGYSRRPAPGDIVIAARQRGAARGSERASRKNRQTHECWRAALRPIASQSSRAPPQFHAPAYHHDPHKMDDNRRESMKLRNPRERMCTTPGLISAQGEPFVGGALHSSLDYRAARPAACIHARQHEMARLVAHRIRLNARGAPAIDTSHIRTYGGHPACCSAAWLP